MRSTTWMLISGLTAAVLAAAPLPAAKLSSGSGAMTPAAFSAATTVRHDPLARTSTFSTEAGLVPSRLSPIRHLLSDNHLRAVVDWRTGARRYEVHQRIFYWGAHARDRRDYGAASYQSAGTTRVGGLIMARDGDSFCPNEDNWGPCALTRQIVFALSEDEVRAIAERGRTDMPEPWTYRIAEQGGRDWTGTILPAEAAGLLLAIDGADGSRG